ncbi:MULTISPECIES: hypothetical protein [unclassified Rhizobium]|uniref:hypothetical protein n=1 Tax=unclassified Rhizobium TaxID=2613769 RepID=UPI000EA9DC4D|nr:MULTISPECIES: hypothetical protein [unclassified Rhizobium]AYG64983.1 hypothetical protein CCGE531_02525 [Rhizobium sp. CCGE531]AYG71468.1 hypothetical protein CCGE532_02515 [Rhizobium sp. CCGE532]
MGIFRITFGVEPIKLAIRFILIATMLIVPELRLVSTVQGFPLLSNAQIASISAERDVTCRSAEDFDATQDHKHSHGRKCYGVAHLVFGLLTAVTTLHGPRFTAVRFIQGWPKLMSVIPPNILRPPIG